MTDERGEIVFEDNILDAGFVQIPALVVFDPELSPGAKMTYAALLWYGWKFREFPGQTVMAQDIGATDRTIRRHLNELEKQEYIRVEQLGLGRTNRYVIRSLRERPVPDRTKMSGLAGHNCPVKPDKNVRSLERQDFTNQTLQQQQPLAAPNASEDRTAVVVASVSTPLTTKDLTARLTALGVANSTARKLIKEHNDASLYRWVCYTEHKLQSGWIPKETPAAWLVSAIRSEDWVIPDWFQTPEEKVEAQAAQRRAAQAEQRHREEAAAQERQEAEAQRRAFEDRLGINEDTRAVWQRTRELLQEQGPMTAALFSAYLLPLENGVATVVTPVQFFCEVIPKHAEAIRAALEEVTGETIESIEVRHIEAS